MNKEWEKAKSSRSHCHRCKARIDQFSKRLKVPAKFGIRDGYMFFCESCASVIYDVSSIPSPHESSDSVRKIVEGGQGRFYKHFRKITLE
jgi:hypothetical protein